MKWHGTHSSTRVTLVAAVAIAALAGTATAVAGSATSSHKHATSIKLNVLASASTPARVKAQDTLTTEFEKAHPGVTIKWQRKSFNDLFATVKLILSGPNSPDIAYLPQGWPMVALVKAGLLVPLDKYEKQYGWDKRFTAGQRREAEASKDGTKFGIGQPVRPPDDDRCRRRLLQQEPARSDRPAAADDVPAVRGGSRGDEAEGPHPDPVRQLGQVARVHFE